MDNPKLSILIPSTFDREEMTEKLKNYIQLQSTFVQWDLVEEVVFYDNKELSIGAKRQKMIEKATGEYVVFVDSDDWVSENYVSEILKALEVNPDCVGLSGTMTTDGKADATWSISKALPYNQIRKAGKVHYQRFTNHLAPIKREIALKVGYRDMRYKEDYDYAVRLLASKLCKTEVVINQNLYHYRYISAINEQCSCKLCQ